LDETNDEEYMAQKSRNAGGSISLIPCDTYEKSSVETVPIRKPYR